MPRKNTHNGEPAPSSRRDIVTTALIGVAALVAIAGFGVLFSLWWTTGVSDSYEILRIASQEFVEGRPIVAGKLAESVSFDEPSDDLEGESDDKPDDKSGEPEFDKDSSETIAAEKAQQEHQRWIRLRDFLVGVGKVARANEHEDIRQRRRHLYEAISFLESARDAGFPAGRQTDGHRILGEALFKLGRYDDAIVALTEASQRDPTLRSELLPLLAEAQLKSVAARIDKSLETIETFLSDPMLRPEQRRSGELIRVRALIGLKSWRQVDDAIRQPLQEKQSAHRDHVLLLQSVARIRRAMDRYGTQPENDYEDRGQAIEELAPTIVNLKSLERQASPWVAARARLWSARAMIVEGRVDDALTHLTAVRQQRPFGAESIIGGLEEIELLAHQGRGVEMLQTTRYMMRELGDPRSFDASLISFEEFRRRLADAIEDLRRNGVYEYAIDTARSLPPIFEVSDALTQEAIGYREWAEATIAEATDIRGQVDRSASILARSRYRAAGDAFAESAKLKFGTEEYVATQWSAIDAYQKGRHFSRSIRLLKPYLRYENRRRHPRGLVAYGRALLAENDPDTAIEALMTCVIEFPRDPLRYDARLLAALAHAEKGDLENARALLTDNLEDGELTPQSPAWKDSLMTLGELLYERGYRNHLAAEQADAELKVQLLRENQPILEDAVRHLDEAVERYWPSPRAASAKYLSARAHVMSSRWPRIESNSPDILDAAKRALRNKADQALKTSLDGFTELSRHLTTREEEQRLPSAEQSMLRNCLLAEADVLREMKKFEDAASAYRAVELRYMNEPPALEAILGRAICAKQLGRPGESERLIRQASVVLQRIPNEWNDRFAETTRYDREDWEDLLGWMNQRIEDQGA